ELVQRLERAQARFLDQIFGIRGLPRQPESHAIQVIEVHQDVLLEPPHLVALAAEAHVHPFVKDTGLSGNIPPLPEARTARRDSCQKSRISTPPALATSTPGFLPSPR